MKKIKIKYTNVTKLGLRKGSEGGWGGVEVGIGIGGMAKGGGRKSHT